MPAPQELPREIRRLRETPLVFPERSEWTIPENVIDLVNHCLYAAFPAELVRPLYPEDIYVYSDVDFKRYQKQQGYRERHSYSIKLLTQLGTRFPEFAREPGVLVSTEHGLQNKPIFYPESQIAFWRGPMTSDLTENLRKASEEALTGKILLHESIHRASINIPLAETAAPILPDDPLFRLAFAAYRIWEKAQRNKVAKKAIGELRSSLSAFAASHDPAITTEGAKVILYCKDDDESLRGIAVSGYDLNEAIVEALTIQAISPLLEYIDDTYGSDIANIIREQLVIISATLGGSSRNQNLIGEIIPYLKSLNLQGPIEVLRAYAFGEIPRLHIKLLSRQEYFT